MMKPASASLTPASHEPSVLPLGNSMVSSPKYHTFSNLSCANQSFVSSTSTSGVPSKERWWTSVVSTSSMVLLIDETQISSRVGLPSLVPSYTNILPIGSGKYWLSMACGGVKLAGMTSGD